MAKIYRMFALFRAWATATDCPVDELAGLSLRDFADLPAYHPSCRQQ